MRQGGQGILSDKKMLDQRLGGSEGFSYAVIWKKRVPGRGNSLR